MLCDDNWRVWTVKEYEGHSCRSGEENDGDSKMEEEEDDDADDDDDDDAHDDDDDEEGVGSKRPRAAPGSMPKGKSVRELVKPFAALPLPFYCLFLPSSGCSSGVALTMPAELAHARPFLSNFWPSAVRAERSSRSTNAFTACLTSWQLRRWSLP